MDTLIAPVISALKEHHATNNFADVERAFVVAEKPTMDSSVNLAMHT